MKKEDIEEITRQLETIETAFSDLEDSFYQIRRCLLLLIDIKKAIKDDKNNLKYLWQTLDEMGDCKE